MGRLGTMDELAHFCAAVRRRHEPLHHRAVRGLRRRVGLTMSSPNEPDFPGVIGRTHRDSVPSWPDPPAGLGGAERRRSIVLDDTGFAHFGCYGSELATPNIDRLAAGGLRYTSFHTTALCSPSRAALLTGRNPHAVGMRGVSNWNTGFPHMRGGITPEPATVAELLRAHGYATYAAGKWHLAPMEECSAAGPHTNWPLQKGFDRFYGFLQGETDQFSPRADAATTATSTRRDRPEDGYHVVEDIVDQVDRLDRRPAVGPTGPAVLPLPRLRRDARTAPGAAVVPRALAGRVRRGLRRRRASGGSPASSSSASCRRGRRWRRRNPGVPGVGRPDRQPARLLAPACRRRSPRCSSTPTTRSAGSIAFLEQRGLLDDTMLLVLSDNGAVPRGRAVRRHGRVQLLQRRCGRTSTTSSRTASTTSAARTRTRNYPWGWAQAGNSPLRWYKQNTYGGGVRDPLDRPLAGRHRATRGEIRRAVLPRRRHHADDPRRHRRAGATERSRACRSCRCTVPPISATFDDAGRARRRGRSSTSSRWATAASGPTAGRRRPTTSRASPSTTTSGGCSTSTRTSRECHDLAAEHPDKLRELIDAVVGRGRRARACCRSTTAPSSCSARRPGRAPSHAAAASTCTSRRSSHMPADAAPPLGGRDVDGHRRCRRRRARRARGRPLRPGQPQRRPLVLRARTGSCTSTTTRSARTIGRRRPSTSPRAARAGRPVRPRPARAARSSIAADGDDLASVEIPTVVRMLGSTGLDIGRDALSPVVDDYAGAVSVHRHHRARHLPHPQPARRRGHRGHRRAELSKE